MSYIRVGAPRNTSNGDYGRFHFTSNNSSMASHGQNMGYSTDGNRMMQHVHYPNCPHRNTQDGGTSGNVNSMQDYTVEYGEDAVRAALGGNMPDFQAQFQKQYGGVDNAGVNNGNIDPRTVQLMNNGKSKIAMLPVVFSDEGDGNEMENQGTDMSKNGSVDPKPSPASQNSSHQVPASTGKVANSDPGVEPSNENKSQAGTTITSKENITNAYESARRARSSGQVKLGRHVRPSYWKPELPNPCRKKVVDGSGDVGLTSNPQEEGQISNQSSNMAMGNSNEVINMNEQRYFAAPQMIPKNVQQHMTPERARSVPPKKSTRPNYSLCGKCRKCKNLRADTPETSVLAFPKYSTGGFQKSPSQMLTSSNLSQSAKNFRAIRFSSTQM